jgi:protein-tyrosine phosphatase
MAEQGVDISEHRARQVSLDIVSRAELILVMDKEQKKYIESKYMAARGKVFRLCEEAKVDIPDPYREGLDSFRNAYHLIDEGVQFWVNQIRRMT